MIALRLTFILISLLLTAPISGLRAQLRPLERKKHQVNRTLDEVLKAGNMKTASLGFLAIDMESGEVIASHQPDLALRPASTFKLLSSATALEILGPEFQFRTSLVLTDSAELIIKGGGDPTLGSRFFDSIPDHDFISSFRTALVSSGRDSIRQVIADASHYGHDMLPPSWSWQNMGQYYGAAPSGLSAFDNTYTLYFRTAAEVGQAAELLGISPHIPLVLENGVVSDTISWDNSYIYGAPYSPWRSIKGSLPVGRDSFGVRGSMPDPTMAAVWHLDSALRSSGIKVGMPATTTRLNAVVQDSGRGDTLLLLKSPTLSEIIRETNTHSVNLYAEHLLLEAGLKLGSEGLTLPAGDSLLSFWERKGMDIQGLSIHDGSGLSQYNAITPRQMIWLLEYMYAKSPHFDEFYASMAIAGKTGTLEPLCKGTVAEGQLRAKSGTISRVKAYAGYVESRSGRKIAFAMSANGFSGSSRGARAHLEKLMISLAELNK